MIPLLFPWNQNMIPIGKGNATHVLFFFVGIKLEKKGPKDTWLTDADSRSI